jgi:hypothetical protein
MEPTHLIDSAGERIEDVKDAVHARVLRRLGRTGIPFLVGGTFGLTRYTGLPRATKDLDLFVEEDQLPTLLTALEAVGLTTSIPHPHWLAKAKGPTLTMDVIFGSGNGLSPVDAEWFHYAHDADLYGVPVRLVPPEELLWSKSFIMERERYDGADVAHLLRARGLTLDWERVERRFGDHVPVLLAHVVLFHYIYADAADYLPPGLLPRLQALAHAALARLADGAVCRGTLLSREQFLPDLEQGLVDARVALGTMSADQVRVWTAAIDQPGR